MLLVVGEALIEMTSESEGPFSSDQRFVPEPGGFALKEAVAAAKQGARVRLLSRIGRDGAGGWIKKKLQQANLELMLQEDPVFPTSLVVRGPDTLIYRLADAHLEPANEAFFEGGRLLHTTAWPFGLDPGRTSAVQTFREGMRRGLGLSMDLNYHPRAFRGDFMEIIRPYLPFTYLKIDEDSLEHLGLKPSELFQLATTVLFFRRQQVRLLSLMDEENFPLAAEQDPEAIYGKFLAAVSQGAEPADALSTAMAE